MGHKFRHWRCHSLQQPHNFSQVEDIIFANRQFARTTQLEYGDHGLEDAFHEITQAIRNNKKIALYADYDVDGTMSCVSWIWFLRAIGYENFTYYIPDRFTEGYGVNLNAVQYLVHERKADVIITMDTGITANTEAEWCRQQGISFICTDHHKIQPHSMPDSIILNPKTHPDADYQELCGCGITFVLLRKLGQQFSIAPAVWSDILALVGMATICDVVPLNGVNHKLAQMGVQALTRSHRPILNKLLKAAAAETNTNEQDIGFRLGPRINAVGRLDHADKVIRAFVDENPDDLIHYMTRCNEDRKNIQSRIFAEACQQAEAYPEDPILFLGGDWHQGVVGIAASKIAEKYWKPVWLFSKQDKQCKGSCRTIPGFDVTDAMTSVHELFIKYGGHGAAGGYCFDPKNESELRLKLNQHARGIQTLTPELWESSIDYDCKLPLELTQLQLMDHLESMRPFGHGFHEPLFLLEAQICGTRFYLNKKTQQPKHTAVTIRGYRGEEHKIMFFNEVYEELQTSSKAQFLVTAAKQTWQGKTSLSLIGRDFAL